MENSKPTQYTFIIRLWREGSEEAPFLWRGSAECVQSGRREYFQTVGKLKETIQRMADDTFGESEQSGDE